MKKPYNNRNTTTIYIKCIQEISSAFRFSSNLTLQTSLLALIKRRKVILLLHCSLQTEHLIKLCLEKIFSEQQIRAWWASWDLSMFGVELIIDLWCHVSSWADLVENRILDSLHSPALLDAYLVSLMKFFLLLNILQLWQRLNRNLIVEWIVHLPVPKAF